MESEELAQIAGDLESLTASPGWTTLLDLLQGEAARQEELATGTVVGVLRMARPIESPELLYRRVGIADGLKMPVAIVDKVLASWAAVAKRIERIEREAR